MNAREVKNQLVIDGTIDAAFTTLLECQEPDAWRAALIELAHAAVDSAVAAERERCANYCDGERLYNTARALRKGDHNYLKVNSKPATSEPPVT